MSDIMSIKEFEEIFGVKFEPEKTHGRYSIFYSEIPGTQLCVNVFSTGNISISSIKFNTCVKTKLNYEELQEKLLEISQKNERLIKNKNGNFYWEWEEDESEEDELLV